MFKVRNVSQNSDKSFSADKMNIARKLKIPTI